MKQSHSDVHAPEALPLSGWRVYILHCADGTYYTGVTCELARRLVEHNACDKKAARYTRARRPVTLVYQEAAADRQAACQREWAIKRLTRQQKQDLIGGQSCHVGS